MSEEYNGNLEYPEACDNENQENIELNDFLLQHQILPNIPLDFNDVEDMPVDTEAFYEGVKEASKLAGFITTLKSVGISSENIMDYILTEKNINMNIELAKMNNQNNIEVTKLNAVKIEQAQL